MSGVINAFAESFYRTGRNIAGSLGLRHHGFGRKMIALLNGIGSFGTRYLLLSRRRPLVIRGHKMYLANRASPSLAFSTKILQGQYERETVLLVERVIQKGMTIIDIGAHVGFHTLLAAKLVGPSGRVYAFEPDPDNFAIIRRNIALNNYGNITAVQKAVADETGKFKLFLSGQGNDRHSIYPNPRSLRAGRSTEVAATSLDDFLSSEGWPRIDFIKMDIEGAEPLALRGMVQLLSRSQSFKLLLEFAPESLQAGGHVPAEFLEELMSLGLAVGSLDESGMSRHLEQGNIPPFVAETECRGVVNLFCELRQE